MEFFSLRKLLVEKLFDQNDTSDSHQILKIFSSISSWQYLKDKTSNFLSKLQRMFSSSREIVVLRKYIILTWTSFFYNVTNFQRWEMFWNIRTVGVNCRLVTSSHSHKILFSSFRSFLLYFFYFSLRINIWDNLCL